MVASIGLSVAGYCNSQEQGSLATVHEVWGEGLGIQLCGEAPDPTNADLRWKAPIGSGGP